MGMYNSKLLSIIQALILLRDTEKEIKQPFLKEETICRSLPTRVGTVNQGSSSTDRKGGLSGRIGNARIITNSTPKGEQEPKP